jgi:hypothetical protein
VALFTAAEARAFVYQGAAQLADVATYPDALIEDAAGRITADFERICDVAFGPTDVANEVLAAGGGDSVLVPHQRLTAVAAAAWRWPDRWGATTWTALTSDQLATLELDPAGLVRWPGRCWPRGAATVRLSYTHGYASPPAAIVRAALILAVNDLLSSNVSDRATQQTNQFGTYNLAVPGWRDGQWYGLPVVDSVLQRYSERGSWVG